MVTPLGEEVAMEGRLGRRAVAAPGGGARGEDTTASSWCSPAFSPMGCRPTHHHARAVRCAREAKTESVQRRPRYIPATATPASCVTATHPPCPE